jgi:hypothetical protein
MAFACVTSPIVALLLLFLTGKNCLLNVEIATWGLTKPVANALATLPFVGPVLESTVAEMRQKYAGRMNLTLSYVVDKQLQNCQELADNIDYLMTKWYYGSRLSTTNVSVFIGSGRKNE